MKYEEDFDNEDEDSKGDLVFILIVLALAVVLLVSVVVYSFHEMPREDSSLRATATEDAVAKSTETETSAEIPTETVALPTIKTDITEPEPTTEVPTEEPTAEETETSFTDLGYQISFTDAFENKSAITLYLDAYMKYGVQTEEGEDAVVRFRLTEDDEGSLSVICGRKPPLWNDRVCTFEVMFADKNHNFWKVYSTYEKAEEGDDWKVILVSPNTIFDEDDSCIYISINALKMAEICSEQGISEEDFYRQAVERIVMKVKSNSFLY